MILLDRMHRLARAGPAGWPRAWSPEQTASFQNTPYHPSLVPLLVDRAEVAAVTPVIETYLRALDATVRRYLSDPAMRAWFGLDPAAEALICAEGEGRARVEVCRLDGYLADGRLWVLENNADAPAGTLFTPRLNAYVAAAAGYRADPRLPMERSEDAFLDVLCPGGAGLSGTRLRARILQPAGRSNRESMEIAAALRGRGVDAEVIDPRQLDAGAAQFCHEGRPVDVIWNKINTVGWRDIIAAAPELVEPWCATLAAGGTRHLNGFAARYVAESKLCHAWLSSQDGRRQLAPDEQRAVAALVPPTVRLGRQMDIPWLADAAGPSNAGPSNSGPSNAGVPQAGDLPGAVLDHQAGLVLKAPYDIRGDGVTVGRAVSPQDWAARLREMLDSDGGVLQRYLAPTEVPVVTDRTAVLRSSLDWFVFDGRVVGLGSKAGVGHKVNLFQGGTKLAVFQEDTS